MKLVKLTLTLRKDGITATANTFDAFETKKAYKWEGSLIKKSLLGVVDSIFIENTPTFISYFTWCVPENIKQAESSLLDKIKQQLDKRKLDIQELTNGIEMPINRRTYNNK